MKEVHFEDKFVLAYCHLVKSERWNSNQMVNVWQLCPRMCYLAKLVLIFVSQNETAWRINYLPEKIVAYVFNSGPSNF